MNGQEKKMLNKMHSDLSIPLAKMEEWVRLHEEGAIQRYEEAKDFRCFVRKRLENLPCDGRKETTKHLVYSTRLLWAVIIVAGIIRGLFFMNGG